MRSAVHVTEAVDALVGLPTATAADVKRLGWRKIMDTAQSQGAVVVTHHGVPEGVVVSAAEFERMQAAGRAAQATQERLLGDYRRQFREHLAVLAEPDTADRMREFMDRPWALQRPISAGEDD